MAYNEEVTMMMSVVPGAMTGISTMMSGLVSINNVFLDMTRQLDASFGLIDTGIITASTIVAQFGIQSAEAFGQFEQGLKVAQMVSGQTAQEMEYLKQKANEFSVSYRADIDQITEGLQTLGRAGLNSASEQTEVLQNGLSTAKLEGRDLNAVLEELIQNTALLGGNLKSSDFGEASKYLNDIMVATSMTAPITTHDVSETLKYSGGIAAAAGASVDTEEGKRLLEDYMGAIAAFAQKGVTGSIAGTALRAFFNKPATQDASVKEALSSLKLKPEYLWEDDEETMKPVSEQIGIIQGQMDKLNVSTMDQLQIWSKIVGGKMGQQMMKLHSEDIKNLTRDIREADDAGSLAAGTFQTFQSRMKEMSEQGQVAFREIGEYAATVLTPVLDILKRILEFFSNPVGAFIAFSAGMGLISAAISKMRKVYAALKSEIGVISSHLLQGEELYTIRPGTVRGQERKGGGFGFTRRVEKDGSQTYSFNVPDDRMTEKDFQKKIADEKRKEKEDYKRKLLENTTIGEDEYDILELSSSWKGDKWKRDPDIKKPIHEYEARGKFFSPDTLKKLGIRPKDINDALIIKLAMEKNIWEDSWTKGYKEHGKDFFQKITLPKIYSAVRAEFESPYLTRNTFDRKEISYAKVVERENADADFDERVITDVPIFNPVSGAYIGAYNRQLISTAMGFKQPNTAKMLSPHLKNKNMMRGFVRELINDSSHNLIDKEGDNEGVADILIKNGALPNEFRQMFEEVLMEELSTYTGDVIIPRVKKTLKTRAKEFGFSMYDYAILSDNLFYSYLLGDKQLYNMGLREEDVPRLVESIRADEGLNERNINQRRKEHKINDSLVKESELRALRLKRSENIQYVKQVNNKGVYEDELSKMLNDFEESFVDYDIGNSNPFLEKIIEDYAEKKETIENTLKDAIMSKYKRTDDLLPIAKGMLEDKSDSDLRQILLDKKIAFDKEKDSRDDLVRLLIPSLFGFNIAGAKDLQGKGVNVPNLKKILKENTSYKYSHKGGLGELDPYIKEVLPLINYSFGFLTKHVPNEEIGKALSGYDDDLPDALSLGVMPSPGLHSLKGKMVQIQNLFNAMHSLESLYEIDKEYLISNPNASKNVFLQMQRLEDLYNALEAELYDTLADYRKAREALTEGISKERPHELTKKEQMDSVENPGLDLLEERQKEIDKRIKSSSYVDVSDTVMFPAAGSKKTRTRVVSTVPRDVPLNDQRLIINDDDLQNPYITDDKDSARQVFDDWNEFRTSKSRITTSEYSKLKNRALKAAEQFVERGITYSLADLGDEFEQRMNYLQSLADAREKDREYEEQVQERLDIMYNAKILGMSPYQKKDSLRDPKEYEDLKEKALKAAEEFKETGAIYSLSSLGYTPSSQEELDKRFRENEGKTWRGKWVSSIKSSISDFTEGIYDRKNRRLGFSEPTTNLKKFSNAVLNISDLFGGPLNTALMGFTIVVNYIQGLYQEYSDTVKTLSDNVKDAYGEISSATDNLKRGYKDQNPDATDDDVEQYMLDIYSKRYDDFVSGAWKNKTTIATEDLSSYEYDKEKDDGSYKAVEEEEKTEEESYAEAVKENTGALYAATAQLQSSMTKLVQKMDDGVWGSDGISTVISDTIGGIQDHLFSWDGKGSGFIEEGGFLLTASQKDSNYQGYTEMAGLMLEDFRDANGNLFEGMQRMLGKDAGDVLSSMDPKGRKLLQNLANFSAGKEYVGLDGKKYLGFSRAENLKMQQSMKMDKKSWQAAAKELAKVDMKKRAGKQVTAKDVKRLEGYIKKLATETGLSDVKIKQGLQLQQLQDMYSVAQQVMVPLAEQQAHIAAEHLVFGKATAGSTDSTSIGANDTASIAAVIASYVAVVAQAKAGEAYFEAQRQKGDPEALAAKDYNEYLSKGYGQNISIDNIASGIPLLGGLYNAGKSTGLTKWLLGDDYDAFNKFTQGTTFHLNAEHPERFYGQMLTLEVMGEKARNPDWTDEQAENYARKKLGPYFDSNGQALFNEDVVSKIVRENYANAITPSLIEQYMGSDIGENEGSSGGGSGSGSGNKGDNNGTRKERVDLVLCNKKEIPKLNVNLFKKPPTFTVLNKNFKLRDVKINTEDTPKAIMASIKNAFIDVQKRTDPKIIQDEDAVYDPVGSTDGNPVPSGTAKTRTDS